LRGLGREGLAMRKKGAMSIKSSYLMTSKPRIP
jgi:hypothetical protein